VAVKRLLADMTLDAVFVHVVFRDRPSAMHRTAFDGRAAQLRALCGVRAPGYWRIVSAEYEEARECLNCRAALVKLTHGSK
jgi:hypothetical protein